FASACSAQSSPINSAKPSPPKCLRRKITSRSKPSYGPSRCTLSKRKVEFQQRVHPSFGVARAYGPMVAAQRGHVGNGSAVKAVRHEVQKRSCSGGKGTPQTWHAPG